MHRVASNYFIRRKLTLTKRRRSQVEEYYRESFVQGYREPPPHSEKPVRNEVPQAGPTPTDRFSRGESGLHST